MSDDARGPIELLRAIQKGSLNPKTLSKESRRACMEHLVGDGYTLAEVAEVFKVSLRTAQRDLARIREEHSVTPTPEVQKQLLGQLLLQANYATARLTKIARDRAAPHSAQVEAAYSAWRVQKELIEVLQCMGIMPSVPQQVQADIHHIVQELPSVLEMKRELAIIEQTCAGENVPPELQERLGSMRSLLAQVDAAAVLQELKANAKEASL